MKKLFLLCFCFIISNNIEAKDFTHAKPDTSEMMIEMSGLLKAGIQKCSFSQNEIEKTNQYLEDIKEILHFYDNISYKFIDDYAKQSESFYTINFPKNDCLTMQESLIDMIKFPESLILEQLYRKIQFLPKEDLKKLNKEYIYSHGFVSPKFNQYNAEQNENGSVWIGKLMPIEQCQEKALRTKNSSMQTYCDNGYAKILVYLPQLKR